MTSNRGSDSRSGDPPVVLVVMGVSGTGKSVVAGTLAKRLGWELGEGDDLHPAANVAKMTSGQPLTDEDRWPWLDKVAQWIVDHAAGGRPGVMTCSALKKAYRDKLRRPGVAFVHLNGTRELLASRLAGRRDHYMPGSLLDSQLGALQPLETDENGIVVELDGKSPEEEAEEIIARLGLRADHPGTR
jgi:gluconokinase